MTTPDERDFTVSWACPMTASDPIAAAQLGRDYVADPASIATCWVVEDGTTRYVVDLEEPARIVHSEPMSKGRTLS